MELAGPLRRVLIGRDHPPPPTRSARWTKIRVWAVPLGLLALTGLAFADTNYLLDHRAMTRPVAGLLAAGAVLPVVVAARRPLLAWRIAYPLLFLGTLGADRSESWPWAPMHVLGFLLVLGTLVAREDSAVIAWVTALNLVPLFMFAPRANAWGVAVLFLVVALAGDVRSRRRRSRAELARQAELTELEQARRAVLEERARIAREMHDVVAHHMSMIAVQAETAPYRIDALPPPALREFTAIAAGAREALVDMRRLLGVLRAETDESPREPQPGLSDVAALVETARRAGVQATLHGPDLAATPHNPDAAANCGQPANAADPAAGTAERDGAGGVDVPVAVGLAAYRIVQEALANAARHAPGGPVQVSVRGTTEALCVEIGNGPGAPPTTTGGGGSGHGLTGMRERATLLGGTLTVGPQPGGGYRVVARLPLGGPR